MYILKILSFSENKFTDHKLIVSNDVESWKQIELKYFIFILIHQKSLEYTSMKTSKLWWGSETDIGTVCLNLPGVQVKYKKGQEQNKKSY